MTMANIDNMMATSITDVEGLLALAYSECTDLVITNYQASDRPAMGGIVNRTGGNEERDGAQKAQRVSLVKRLTLCFNWCR